MSETDEGGTRSKTGSSGGKTLSLKRTETSTVRQSFSHGRSKAVVVEKKRARVMPGMPAAPEKPVKHEEHAAPEARDIEGRRPSAARGGVVLRELTDTIPGDAWLTNFSADRNGLELGGFANAASQLIPLLEASPSLERVEFTSPVTKGRDREQFRLRATWERSGGAR